VPTDLATLVPLAALVLAAAVLYSAGGHGGASAYLALMALFGISPLDSKPTALLMNAAVTILGTVRFSRVGAVPWRTVLWFAAGSVPAAFVTGHFKLETHVHQLVLGAVLGAAACLIALSPVGRDKRPPPPPLALAGIGVALGALAGATGIGGGVFLTPILLLTGWEEARPAAGAAAVFILLNSISGLAGHLSAGAAIPPLAALFVAVAFSGALVGTWLGAKRLAPSTLRRVHAAVLLVSGAKLLYDGVFG
jgi:uncharacterized membrane protein YfcA